MNQLVKKYWNTEDTNYLCEDIINRYYLTINKNEISKVIKDYIYKLCENCANIFGEEDIWSIIQVLSQNDCLTEEVLKYSTIQKFSKVSSPLINSQIKDEVGDLAVNKVIRHIDEKTSEEKEYRTKCCTIDSLKEQISFGNLITTLRYSNNGFDLNRTTEVNIESKVDFSKNNVLIKVKEDISNGNVKKYVRVIIVKKM